MQPQELLDKITQDDNLAIHAFKQYRLTIGLTCKKCGHHDHYWLASKNQFQCKKCRFRTTIRSGSIMESCKLPLSYFFIAMVLLQNSDGKLSVDELHIVTKHKYYEPIWGYLHKMKSYYKEKNIQDGFRKFIKNYEG
jgi:hypothetical protein